MANGNCKGKCGLSSFRDEYDTTKIDRNAFRLGYKRCRKCQYYIKYEGVWCPCCGEKLAIRPRNAKSKRLYNKDVVRL